MKPRILVSACLLGCPCRYDGDSRENEAVLALADEAVFIPVCPEQLGGLPTPRTPSERLGDRVFMKTGEDVTAAYRKGAETALRMAKLLHADCALLKAHSPSCGKGLIYDGSFTGNKIPGDGVTAALLREKGIPVFTEEELPSFYELMQQNTKP